MSANHKKNERFLIIKVPADLRVRFKTVCAQRGRSMKDVLVGLLEREVKRTRT